MNCDNALHLLGLEHDGRLPASDRRRLDDHVAGCAACAGEKRWLARLGDVAGSLVDRETPPDLAARIAAGATTPGIRDRAPFRIVPLLRTAAAFLLVLTLGGVVGYGLGDDGGPVEAAPSVVQRDEATFRSLLKDRLGLSAREVERLVDIRRRHDALLADVERRRADARSELERAEIRELWNALPEAARTRLATIDPHFVPAEAERR
jgi:hypothetical protein